MKMKIRILFVFALFLFCLVGAVSAIAAQDIVTNTPIAITTPEPSPTVVGADQPVATAEPTAPADNGTGSPTSTDDNPTNNLPLMWLLAVGGYLGWCSLLAVSVTTGLELIKPKTIEPFKDKLSPDVYLSLIYLIRLILTCIGYFYMWGGVASAKHYLPGLPATVPDIGVTIATILLITIGTEFLHSLLDRFKAFGDVARLLIGAKRAEVNLIQAQTRAAILNG
jgi:hypothetical protein